MLIHFKNIIFQYEILKEYNEKKKILSNNKILITVFIVVHI